jgi:hypothetical protein
MSKIRRSQRGRKRHVMIHMPCMLDKQKLHELTRMHTPTRARAHTHTHTLTHKTQMCNIYSFSKATMIRLLRYTYIVCRVTLF